MVYKLFVLDWNTWNHTTVKKEGMNKKNISNTEKSPEEVKRFGVTWALMKATIYNCCKKNTKGEIIIIEKQNLSK